MGYDSSYLNTHETALAVVATAMKKSRLRIDTLILNSVLGGVLFSSGGMLYIQVTGSPELSEVNPGVLHLLQGLVYPIGLFYVVILGMELFNSNVLFFSAALMRGGVSIIDMCINLVVSWWFNLVGNIFVCYIFCKFTKIGQETLFIDSSINVVKEKVACSFVETFLKAVAGNFYVSLAIYLQMMTKPLHVKYLMMTLPVFTFVSLGFTHSVADMYLLTMGLIIGAPESVGRVVWRTFLPGALGNIIGGSFFGIVFAWYAHIVVVERDRKELDLPEYELRDEQPDLNMDSRVVRQRVEVPEGYIYDTFDENDNLNSNNFDRGYTQEGYIDDIFDENDDLNSNNSDRDYVPQGIVSDTPTLSRMYSRTSKFSSKSCYNVRSPKNVFPVYGMGPALHRERSIASGRQIDSEQISTDPMEDECPENKSAEYLSSHLRSLLNKGASLLTGCKGNDIEAQNNSSTSSIKLTKCQPARFKQFSSVTSSNIDKNSRDSIVPKKKITPHTSLESEENTSYRTTFGLSDQIISQEKNIGALSEKSDGSSSANSSIS